MPERNALPRQARSLFLKSKKDSLKESSYRAYRFPTKHFIQYLESENIVNIREVDGYVIENWKLTRKADGIAPATFKSNVKHVAVFVRWCERTNLVETGVGDQIVIPNIAIEDEASHKTVSKKRAEDILRYLEKFEYGTRQHAIFYFLWQTGCRISGAITLDLDDFHPTESKIEFRDRKTSETALKNGSRGERNVTLTDDLIRVLSDYIDISRDDVRDEYDRRPLFTTGSGRIRRQVVYKNVVGFTRPCVYDGGCPHNREIENCDAAQNKKKGYECPGSISMHPIRRGSITNHLNQGWPKEKVSERCDVSVSILEKHYNEQSKEDERQTRRKFLDRL